MINQNPYSLPLKSSHHASLGLKTITLQKKRNKEVKQKESQQKSNEYSQQLSGNARGIKLQSKMKKSSHNLKTVSSSPNLHSLPTTGLTPRGSTNVSFSNSYIPHEMFNEFDKKLRYLYEKIAKINQETNINTLEISQLKNYYGQIKTLTNKKTFHQSKKMNESDPKKQNITQNESSESHTQSQQFLDIGQKFGESHFEGNQKITAIEKQIIDLKQLLNRNNKKIDKTEQMRELDMKSLKKQIFSTLSSQLINYSNKNKEKLKEIQEAYNSIKINDSQFEERQEILETQIKNSMAALNEEINVALSQIVDKLNAKIAKSLQTFKQVSEKLDKFEAQLKESSVQNLNQFLEKLKLSLSQNNRCLRQFLIDKFAQFNWKQLCGVQKVQKRRKIKLKVLLESPFSQQSPTNGQICAKKPQLHSSVFISAPNLQTKQHSQLVVSDFIYYVDQEGYLMDKNQNYLTSPDQMLLRLEERNMQKLREWGLFA